MLDPLYAYVDYVMYPVLGLIGTSILSAVGHFAAIRTKKEIVKVSFPVLETVAGIDRLCLEHILRPRSPTRAAQTSACSPVRRTASLTALPSRYNVEDYGGHRYHI